MKVTVVSVMSHIDDDYCVIGTFSSMVKAMNYVFKLEYKMGNKGEVVDESLCGDMCEIGFHEHEDDFGFDTIYRLETFEIDDMIH